MFRDYGKMAYIKVTELEKKFELLKKELSSSKSNTLSFDLVTPEKRTTFTKEFLCKCLKSSTSNLKIDFESNLSISINYKLTVNGNKIQSGQFAGGKGVIELQAGVGEGNLYFKIELSAGVQFVINKLFVVLSGNVEYLSEFSRLTTINLSQISYITSVNRNQLTIYGYDQSGLFEIYKISDVKDGAIGGFVNDELYVLYIDTTNVLRVLVYDVINSFGVIANLNLNGVTSVCGYAYGEGIRIFYVLTGNVYFGDYVKYGLFKGEKVNRKGVKVCCEPHVIGAYIISDASNSNKLVTENGTYVLGRGENHHLIKTPLGYVITYSDKNVLYAQEIDDSLNTPIQIDYCDEKLVLYDGSYLVRVIDSLKIRKD